jgi:hypothetical protein
MIIETRTYSNTRMGDLFIPKWAEYYTFVFECINTDEGSQQKIFFFDENSWCFSTRHYYTDSIANPYGRTVVRICDEY